jgi:hypothetical protein
MATVTSKNKAEFDEQELSKKMGKKKYPNASRQEKIGFILSSRVGKGEKMSDSFYKYLNDEYKKIPDNELHEEFKFHYDN